jgi:hypothetical protein
MLPVINRTTTPENLATLRAGTNVTISIGGATGQHKVKKVGRIALKADVPNPLTVHRHGGHQPYKPFEGEYLYPYNTGLNDKHYIEGLDGVVLEDAAGNTTVVGPDRHGKVTTYDSGPFDI